MSKHVGLPMELVCFFFFSNDSFSAKCTSLVSALCSDCSLSFLAKFFTVADPKRKSTSWENAFFFSLIWIMISTFLVQIIYFIISFLPCPKLHVKLCSGGLFCNFIYHTELYKAMFYFFFKGQQ